MGEGEDTETSEIIWDAPVEPRKDALDRLERVIDVQRDLINEIDTKAEHVSKFVTLLLGVLLTGISLLFEFGGDVTPSSLATEIAFGIAIVALFIALSGAVITYLSSKFILGLHHDIAYTLQESPLTMSEYTLLAANSYASSIEQNKDVLEANNLRFRYTLSSLVCGLGYLALSGLLYVSIDDSDISFLVSLPWWAFGIGTVVVVGVTGYIATGRYLTLQEED